MVSYFKPIKWLTFIVGVERASKQHPTAKVTVNKKKAANATSVPKQDKNAGRILDDMDGSTNNVPGVPQQGQKDARQKKRRMCHTSGMPLRH